jgi:hypothetical protein
MALGYVRETSPELPVRMISPKSINDSIEIMASIAREDKPVNGAVKRSFLQTEQTTCGPFCKNLSAEEQRDIIRELLIDRGDLKDGSKS